MTFRESINALIDATKPQSPTDAIFIFGMLMLIAMQVYALLAHTIVPHFDAMLIALGTLKSIKVGSDYYKAKGDAIPPAEGIK